MKTNDEPHAEAERRSVAASLASVMRATVFAGTVALPMAMLAALAGLDVWCGLIVGFDNDDPGIFARQTFGAGRRHRSGWCVR